MNIKKPKVNQKLIRGWFFKKFLNFECSQLNARSKVILFPKFETIHY